MKVAATEIKAPGKYSKGKYTIFLAGAIDQGQAEDWQKKIARSLDDLDLLVLNPRRDDWDSSLEQVASNPEFKQQVMWEVTAMEAADLVVYVFTKDSKAPITFFEFGAFGTTKDAIVCAEDGFYRQGNLDIYCEHFDVPIYHNLDEMIADLHALLEERV
jgi:hypothetical protein